MAISAIDVKSLGSELSTLTDPFIDQYISIAEGLVLESVWGCAYDNVLKLMTAHLVTLGSRAGSGGSVTSEKVGDLAKSYSTVNSNAKGLSELMLTSYGIMVVQLSKTQIKTPLCV